MEAEGGRAAIYHGEIKKIKAETEASAIRLRKIEDQTRKAAAVGDIRKKIRRDRDKAFSFLESEIAFLKECINSKDVGAIKQKFNSAAMRERRDYTWIKRLIRVLKEVNYDPKKIAQMEVYAKEMVDVVSRGGLINQALNKKDIETAQNYMRMLLSTKVSLSAKEPKIVGAALGLLKLIREIPA